MTTAPLQPWEVPLDEAYWRGLLSDIERLAPPESSPSGDRDDTWPPCKLQHRGSPPADIRSNAERAEALPNPDVRESPGVHTRYAVQADSLAADWERAVRLFKTKERVELRVTGHNRGGLLVKFGQIQGFIPASQLCELPKDLNNQSRQVELSGRLGEQLCLRVIELDPARNRLILSERVAISEDRDGAKLLQTLSPGQTRIGRVNSLCGFGAFVDLGGVEGFIHISEFSWGRVDHPSDMLQVGDEVRVYVIDVQPAQSRVSLSLKRLTPDPWTLVDQRYQVGQIVEGEVTNVVSFGAFVRVEEGLEGLIHISELAEGNFLHPRNVVQEGDHVRARIIRIDSGTHRLGLSLRQMNESAGS
jgi:small subunit ribosomal protein S1